MNSTETRNESTWYPRVLVIGPDERKGFAGLGLLSPIEDSGLLEYVDTYGGVSIGALISLLMICGYRIREIVGEVVKLDIFKEIGTFDFTSVIERKGFISSEPIRKRLTQLVVNKFGNVPTLHGLYMMTGKSFVAVSFNATDEKCIMLNPFDHGDMSCVDATMFSMNLPFIFYQLVYQGKTYVDGSLANPYPIDYFDDGKTNILGIYMKSAPNKTQQQSRNGIIQRIDNNTAPLPMGAYYSKMIRAVFDHRYYSIVQRSSDRCKHICAEIKGDDLFNATTETKAAMLVEGFNIGKTFLQMLQTNTYVGPNVPSVQHYVYPPYFIMGEDTVNTNEESVITEMSLNG